MSSIYAERKMTHDKEMSLRNIMAIIYRGGHWTNQAEKFDEILIYISDELMKEQKEQNWLRVIGVSTDDSAYCNNCINLDAIPDEQSFTIMYDRDYRDGFTCVECCDVIEGESNE